jgi:hypothetical protein
MDPATAKSVIALAAQVNNSLLAEVKAARFTLAADQTYSAIGALPIGLPSGRKDPAQIEVESAS